MTRQNSAKTSNTWLITAGLILLSLIPVIAGTARVGQLASGAAITPENARFFDSPVPVVLHIIGASVYALLGAFQFSASFRHRYPRWHRKIGWMLIPFGLIAALTGLWMAHFYPWPVGDGQALYVMRLIFGAVMTLALVLAVVAIGQRKFIRHGAWMTRAYAIGMGAGTQVLTHIAWSLLVGTSGEFARTMIMGSGWVINIVIAEWVIYKRLSRPKRKPTLLPSPAL
jgi:hypothetical protein